MVMYVCHVYAERLHGLLMDQPHIFHKHRPEPKGLLIGINIFIFQIDFP